MAIIPVLDLLGGVVVRGVGGRRDEYRPVESVWVESAAPGEVARMFLTRFGFQRAYVADLDAIARREANWEAIEKIAKAGLSVLLDAGVSDATGTRAVLARAASCDGVVFGLESSPDPERLAEGFAAAGAERGVFSLDLKCGVPLSDSPSWKYTSPLRIAETAIEIGFRRLIVLDLASVGGGEGGRTNVLGLCRAIRSSHPQIELISGGGVRDLADVREFHAAGCDGVLVASALHNGRIPPPA